MKHFLEQVWLRHQLALEPEKSKARLVFAEIAGECERVAEQQRERLKELAPPTESPASEPVKP
jgi:hypothetical protein